jgi:hypothetical protein
MMIDPFSIVPWKVTRMWVQADVLVGSFIPAVIAAPGDGLSKAPERGIRRAYRSRHRRDLHPGLE